MIRFLAISAFLLGTFLMTAEATAVTCAKGVYRAGCVGPSGAVATTRPPPRAAAVGPRGAVVAGPRGVAARRRY